MPSEYDNRIEIVMDWQTAHGIAEMEVEDIRSN
jgi:hypothetical protein